MSGTMILELADVARIGALNGANMHMKLTGAYDLVPKGKTPGVFYPSAM